MFLQIRLLREDKPLSNIAYYLIKLGAIHENTAIKLIKDQNYKFFKINKYTQKANKFIG